MTEKAPVDGAWLADALRDCEQELAHAINLLEEDPRRGEGVLEHEIPALYAKLNFAVNTARTGPDAIASEDHDELVAFPAGLPFRMHAPDPKP